MNRIFALPRSWRNVGCGGALPRTCWRSFDPSQTSSGRGGFFGASTKEMLHRMEAMLTRMAIKFDGVAEPVAAQDAGIDYDHDNEHRCAEHEYEVKHKVRESQQNKNRNPGTDVATLALFWSLIFCPMN
ncbi:MAG: hypothetical protein JNM43_14135 [Planctomycetaceae bacterium]|nr:hypothetical protein [Planctomycetaceae bacterium]